VRFVEGEIRKAEKVISQLQTACSEIDQAMYEPANASPGLADQPMSALLAKRAKLTQDLEAAESEWIRLGEQLETN
jgi:ATP-binding cassette subfamily F protein 3